VGDPDVVGSGGVEGPRDGAAEGSVVGTPETVSVGDPEGSVVGTSEAVMVGDADGFAVGEIVGLLDGEIVGDVVGLLDGEIVGGMVGAIVGDFVGVPDAAIVGGIVGAIVGDLVGVLDAAIVGGMVGAVVGDFVGAALGFMVFVGEMVGPSLVCTYPIATRLSEQIRNSSFSSDSSASPPAPLILSKSLQQFVLMESGHRQLNALKVDCKANGKPSNCVVSAKNPGGPLDLANWMNSSRVNW